jgi:hypothetical protein
MTAGATATQNSGRKRWSSHSYRHRPASGPITAPAVSAVRCNPNTLPPRGLTGTVDQQGIARRSTDALAEPIGAAGQQYELPGGGHGDQEFGEGCQTVSRADHRASGEAVGQVSWSRPYQSVGTPAVSQSVSPLPAPIGGSGTQAAAALDNGA